MLHNIRFNIKVIPGNSTVISLRYYLTHRLHDYSVYHIYFFGYTLKLLCLSVSVSIVLITS